MSRTIVGEIADLETVDPDGHAVIGHDKSFMKPLEIVSHHRARFLPAIETTSAVIERLIAVAILESVVDLALVSVAKLSWNAAKEDARVEMLAIGDDFQLQHEVVVLADTFELPIAVLDIQFASGGDTPYAFFTGKDLPLGEIRTIEDAF